MPYDIDETHDPNLESWVESANDPETDFPIQNLPLCTFWLPGATDKYVGVRIGDKILSLYAVVTERSLLPNALWEVQDSLEHTHDATYALHQIMPRDRRRYLRKLLVDLLKVGARPLEGSNRVGAPFLYDADEVTHLRPYVGDYTDFYASVHHATNVGSMFRPDNPLLPNYKWIPVGYHGRASSVVPSGTPITRPRGQQAPAEDGGAPGFGPCKMLDYELEVGVIVGRGNELGSTIGIADAEDHILGLCLLNDWSARDMQKWEYQPLGPFLAKSFATSVSPYIVTMEALAPFRSPRYERPAGDPQPLPHLESDHDRSAGAIDLTLEVYLQTADMRQRGLSPHRLSKGNFKDMYWTVAQMLTHHASNGCNMQPGDLLGSGTVSGPTRDSRGCLLELTWDGDPWASPPVKAPTTQRTPIKLDSGEERRFLQDGDEIILKGYCERDGFRRIGFGECRGIIEPAK